MGGEDLVLVLGLKSKHSTHWHTLAELRGQLVLVDYASRVRMRCHPPN